MNKPSPFRYFKTSPEMALSEESEPVPAIKGFVLSGSDSSDSALSGNQADMIPAFLVFILVGTSIQFAYSKWLKASKN